VTEPPLSPPSPSPDGVDPPRPPPAATWSERLAALGDVLGVDLTPARLIATLVVVAGVAMAGYAVLRSEPAPPPEETLPFAGEAPAPEQATTSTVATEVVVHAAGAVGRPGLYRLAAGARVADVLAAAGGATTEADLNRINLAAPVEDGQQVYVPGIGEALPAPADPPGGAGGSGTETAGPVDINTADVDLLDTLPGVGPATAQAIVAYRDEHGSFGSVEELLDVPGIGEAKLERLRPLVTV
jgi:competence protein ComEA